MQCILIADNIDEKEIFSFILRRTGMAVNISTDVSKMVSSWSEEPFDCIVLALNGTTIPFKQMEKIRSISHSPVLMVLDPLPEADFCALMEAGVDIVLQRPVSARVLAAQARVLMRRSSSVPYYVLPSLKQKQIELDSAAHMVTREGEEPIRLTQLEFRLLYTLMTHPGQVVPTEVIVERVWGYSGEGNRDLVRGLMSRLRKKIELFETDHFLETIPGVGYRFLNDSN
ncbi:MAG: response regulator transcription factor [Anaerolineales bacterium]|nr:response regulator transcription factor [Anaerolineales bacterium]